MTTHSTRTAVIIGASSGIGEALAHELDRAGWRLALLARRLERLQALRETLAPKTVVRALDVGQRDAAAILEQVLEELGGVDLAIISAGTGHNEALHWELDVETVTVNVLGFMAVAQVTMRHSLRRGHGSQTNPSSRSETEEACVHNKAVRAGRFHPQTAAATRLGKQAHRARVGGAGCADDWVHRIFARAAVSRSRTDSSC
jgi:NADP-dependent 3-hydroxy acid dehydrogenase YdfG